MTAPAIYVTNAAHARLGTPTVAGGGNVWSIMARPRVKFGEAGHGRCWPLVPDARALTDVRAATNAERVRAQVAFDGLRDATARERDVPEISVVGYFERQRDPAPLRKYRDFYFDGPARRITGTDLAPVRALHPELAPGALFAEANAGRGLIDVRPRDTLICACAVEKAKAGECHRAWAAVLLAANGWSVVLDGTPLDLHNPPSPLRGLWPRPRIEA